MRLLRNIFFSFLVLVAVSALTFTFWIRDRYVVPILTYHHIDNSHKALNSVSVESFERQMRYIKSQGYDVISFGDLVTGIKKGYAFSRNTVVIQFDDGYKDNYTNAFPILKKYEFPAMVFLVSDLIGKDPEFMSWDDVKEMERFEFEAGAHTRHHKYLPPLKTAEKWDEIAGSKKVIEEHLGHAIDFFAYPSGGFDEESKEIASKAGYKAAVTTNRGKDRFNRKLFELNRIHMKDTDSNLVMWGKLSGYYNLFRKSKNKQCNKACDDKGYNE